MATSPVFTASPKAGVAQLTAANTNRDGTGTLVDLFTAGASGSRIEHVEIVAASSTTAGVVRLFLYDGTNSRLIKEVLVTAATPSTSVPVFSTSLDFSTQGKVILLPSGYKLQASTHNAETFNVVAYGGDF